MKLLFLRTGRRDTVNYEGSITEAAPGPSHQCITENSHLLFRPPAYEPVFAAVS